MRNDIIYLKFLLLRKYFESIFRTIDITSVIMKLNWNIFANNR